MEIFNKHKIPIELVTNGINLSKEKIEIMNSYHVVGYSLSIEGSNSETHDFIRGEGTFKKVISSISNLKKFSNAFQVDVEVIYGKHNMMQIEEIVKLLSDLGVTSVKFARLKPWDWGQQLSNIVPNKEEIKKVNEKIWNIEGKYKGIKIMGDVPKSIEDQKVPGCNINVGFEIQPDGNVLPCRIFEQRVDDKIILGNIKSQDIFEIWNSEKAKRIRSYSKRLSKRFLCTKCEFARFCSTNYCIAENFLTFGKFIPSEEDLNKCKI